VKVHTLADLVITHRAGEAFEVIFLIDRLEDLTFNPLATFGAGFCEHLVEVELAIRLVVVLMELVAFEGLPAFRADEMVRVPGLSQSRDVLTFDDFIAMAALRVESGVVATLTEMRAIALDEGLTAQRDIAGVASEALCVEGLLLRHHESRINAAAAFVANLRITTTAS